MQDADLVKIREKDKETGTTGILAIKLYIIRTPDYLGEMFHFSSVRSILLPFQISRNEIRKYNTL